MTGGYHRRAEDPPHARYEHGREVDTDKVAKFMGYYERGIKLLVIPFWLFAGWFFLQLYPAIKGYPIAIEKLEQAESDRGVMNRSLSILIRMQCAQMTQEQRIIAALDCRDIPLPTQQEIERALENVKP